MIDVLFITRPAAPADSEAKYYKDLRLDIKGTPATIPALQRIVAGRNSNCTSGSGDLKKPADFVVLTPIYIKEFLRRQGLSMEIVSNAEQTEEIKAHIAHGVRVIAMSTTWMPAIDGAHIVRSLAKRIKHLAPNIPLIVGGAAIRKAILIRDKLKQGNQTDSFLGKNNAISTADATHSSWVNLAKQYLVIDPHADRDIDAIVTTEAGEHTLAAIIKRVKDGLDFRDLPGTAIPNAQEYRFNPPSQIHTEIDSFGIDWRQHCTADFSRSEIPILHGVGCPFRCGFCDFHSLKKRQARSTHSLTAELKSLADSADGKHNVYFIDENLGTNRKGLLQLTDAIAASGVTINWRAFIHVNAIDREVATALQCSGCRELLIGIESGDPTILKNMNKKIDLDRALEAIHHLDSVGIRTQCTFVVGFPGESASSIENTTSFISALPSGNSANSIHRYFLFRFMVFPLSPVAKPEQRKQFGLTGIGSDWSHSTMDASEAAAAMKEIFQNVRGPTHMYLEHIPGDWPTPVARKVLEIRETIQKQVLQGNKHADISDLLDIVRRAGRSQTSNAQDTCAETRCR